MELLMRCSAWLASLPQNSSSSGGASSTRTTSGSGTITAKQHGFPTVAGEDPRRAAPRRTACMPRRLCGPTDFLTRMFSAQQRVQR